MFHIFQVIFLRPSGFDSSHSVDEIQFEMGGDDGTLGAVLMTHPDLAYDQSILQGHELFTQLEFHFLRGVKRDGLPRELFGGPEIDDVFVVGQYRHTLRGEGVKSP